MFLISQKFSKLDTKMYLWPFCGKLKTSLKYIVFSGQILLFKHKLISMWHVLNKPSSWKKIHKSFRCYAVPVSKQWEIRFSFPWPLIGFYRSHTDDWCDSVQYRHLITAPVNRTSASAWLYKHPWIICRRNEARTSMTHVAYESKLCSYMRSSMHPCPGAGCTNRLKT